MLISIFKTIRFTLIAIVWAMALSTQTFAQTTIIRNDLVSLFDLQNTKGTFVLLDLAQNEITLVNSLRANIQFYPASTFKIANSLIALETEVIKDEHEIIPYGDKPQLFKSWQQDMTMARAIKISNVAIYQELARRIGISNYLSHLKKLEYGNQKIDDRLDMFWLSGPLKISAIEQVKFLTRLAQKQLPYSLKHQKTVANIIKLETKNDTTLFGKTGWTLASTPHLGWFVGWVQRKEQTYIFALNMDMVAGIDGDQRSKIAMSFLQKLAIYEHK